MKKLREWFTEHNINYKKWLIVIYVVFVMVPVLIYIGINDPGRNVLVGTLASVLLLVFFVVFFIYDYRKKIAEDWGMISLTVEKDYYKDAAKILANAKTVNIVLSYDFEEVYNIIKSCESKNICTYNILILNPYSEFAELSGNSSVYARYADEFERLAEQSRSEINIKYYSLMPIDNIFIIDDTVFIYPMTQQLSDGRRLCKSYKGKKKGLERYKSIFNKAWEHPIYENLTEEDAQHEEQQ